MSVRILSVRHILYSILLSFFIGLSASCLSSIVFLRLLLPVEEVRELRHGHLLERFLVLHERHDPDIKGKPEAISSSRPERRPESLSTYLLQCSSENQGLRWVLSFALRSGVPSSRRLRTQRLSLAMMHLYVRMSSTYRLCPTGYRMSTSSRTVPSLSVMVSAFPIERESGLW